MKAQVDKLILSKIAYEKNEYLKAIELVNNYTPSKQNELKVILFKKNQLH